MKQIILMLAMLATTSSFAFANKAKIPFGERQVLNKVYDLPNTAEFNLDNANYVDLATLHTEFNIAYILPLYITQEPILVAYDEQTEKYFGIPEDELKRILATQNLKMGDVIGLPFYTRYGCKIMVLLFIALLIWGSIPSEKRKIIPKNV
ncbi:hypothetical protein [Pedobacter cryotolerans]|uniref:Uncharacterized protein n=1 Tax=Pedobacter cryotolerans TaxID=2571270 RepID=A0A4U1C8A1_9SPHI|nr:hypothetical protein [Pedobacter cryotolerans]TKC01771.1 hypothetical protein FA045_05835 [Pedobacter cryotolerans]